MSYRSPHLIFLLLILIGQHLHAQDVNSPFVTKTYTSQDGLPHSYVYEILQDHKGYLWISTRYGISRFDGQNFVTTTYNDEIKNIPFGYLTSNESGNVCMLSDDELYFLEIDKKISHKIRGSYFPYYVITEGGKTERKGYWTITKEGLYPLYGGALKEIIPAPDTDNKKCRKIFETDSGWYCNYLNEFVFSGKNGQSIDISKSLPASRFIVAMGFRNNEFYIYTNTGVYAYSQNGIRTLFKKQLAGKHIYAAFLDSKDRMWLGIHEDGIAISQPGEEEELSYSIQISHNLISGFYEDREGNIWVAGFEGLIKVQEKKFETFSIKEYPFLEDLNIAAMGREGAIFFFSETHGVSKWQSGKFTYQPENPFKGHLIDEICLDDKNRFWCSTRRRELMLYDQSKVRKVNCPLHTMNDLQSDIIYDPYRDKIWITGEKLLLGDEKGFIIFKDDQNNSVNIPLKVGLLSNGQIIMATASDGLFKISPSNRLQRIRVPAQFQGGKVHRIFVDSSDYVWFSYAGNGLFKGWISNDNSLEMLNRYSRDNGLTNDFIQSLAFDRAGRLWLSTMAGITVLDFEHGASRNPAIYLFGREEGVQPSGMEYGHLVCDAQGDMWYSTQNALMRFRLKEMEFKYQPNYATIENVMLNNQETDWYKYTDSLEGVFRVPVNPVMNYRDNTVTILYKAASMSNATHVQYSYLLSGLNNDWSNPSKNNTITFSNLKPGHYTFFVRSSSTSLDWSTPAMFTFSIRKPYWLQWWFIAVFTLGCAGIIYQIYLIRIRQMNKEKMIRDQIAGDLHDDLGSTLNSVKVYANVASLDRDNQQYLENIRENIQEAITSLRDIIWVLDEKKDTVEHLVNRISQFEFPLCHANHIEFEQQVDPAVSSVLLGREEKRNLFMILKEAINNSIKHAACKTISLSVLKESGKLVFQIGDDGIGINQEIINEGHGLNNMRRRAVEIKYELKIMSQKGAGTNIFLVKK